MNDLESKRASLQQHHRQGLHRAQAAAPRRQALAAQPGQHANPGCELAEKQSYAVQQSGGRRRDRARCEAQRAQRRHTADARPRRHLRPEHRQPAPSPARSAATSTPRTIGLQLACAALPGRQPELARARGRRAVDASRRTTWRTRAAPPALTARQTYLAVINGIAQVGALEQALDLLAERARLEPARLRGGRAHQHRRA